MLAVGFAAFFLFGAVLVILGATQDSLVTALEIDLSQFGLLGAALSGGIGLGVVTAGPLVDRLPRRPLFAVATAISAAALFGFSPGMSFALALALVVLLGFGSGIYDTLLNAVTVEQYPETAVRMLALLHASVTVGAVATPWLVGQLLSYGNWTHVYRVVAAAFVLVTFWGVATTFPPPKGKPDVGTPTAGAGLFGPAGLARFATPSFAALCCVGLLYIGVEAALTLFAVPYASEGLGLVSERGRGAISSFWFGILAARIGLALWARPIGGLHIAGAGVLGAGILSVSLLFSWSAVEVTTGLTGLVLGIVFPLMITLAGRQFPDSPGTATGLVAGLGSFGGFGLPWLVGAVADGSGARAGFACIAVACALLGLVALAAEPRESA